MTRPDDAVFRFRASQQIGGGHAVRSLALASELGRLGWRCVVETNDEATEVVGELRRSGLPIHSQARDAEAGLMVIDDFDIAASQEAEQRQRAEAILVSDDLADRRHDCDLLLDPTPGRAAADYDGLVPDTCRRLIGPRHALLRPAFRRARKAARARRAVPAIHRVLIMPGQVDQANLAGLAMTALQEALPDAAVDIVLGAGAPHRATVEAAAGPKVTFHVDLDDNAMADLMTQADLAIGAGGGSALERCVLGLPTMIVVVADNQRFVAEGMRARNAAMVPGRIEDLGAADLVDLLTDLSVNPEKLTAMTVAASEVCDGRGVERVAIAAAGKVDGSDGAAFTLRAAETDDAQLLHDWQSDPEIRRHARNPDVPAWDGHVAWLDRTLEDRDRVLMLVERNGEPTGMLRLDRNNEGFEVSVVAAPERRGQGVGGAALQLGRKLARGHVLTAFVKDENTASKRLFLDQNYVATGDGIYRQVPAA